MIMNLKFKTTLVAWAALLMCSTSVQAQSIQLAFRDTTVVGGTTFDYPIYVDSSLTGRNISSYQLEFTFNASYFTFVGVTGVGTMTSSWTQLEANEVSTGRIRVAGSGATDLSGTGKLVIVQLAARIPTSNVSGSFSFQNSLLNEGTPPTIHRNGTVTVQRRPFITIVPKTWLMTKGETKLFTILGGVAPYTWSTTNPGVATVGGTGLLTAVNRGFTRVICSDSLGVIDTSGLVEVHSLKLSVRDTSRYQGQILDLPLYTTDVTGLGIASGQLAVTYDQNLWTATGVVQAGTLLASSSAPEFLVTPGKITISFAGSSSLSGSGILLYVRMQATSTTYGTSSIGFQDVLFNQDILANTSAGYATVSQLSAINVSPGGSQTLVKGDSIQFTTSGGTSPYAWSVSDSQRASISPSGVLKARRGGSVIVYAKDALGSVGSSGTINLYDFRLSVPDLSYYVVTAGDSVVEVPLTVTGNDTGFYAFQVRITYTTGHFLKLDSVIIAGTIVSSWAVVPSYASGVVQMAAAGVNPVTAGGTLVKLRFVVPDSTPRPSTTYISLTNVVFNEGSPLPLIDNGYVQIRTTNSSPYLQSRSPSTLDSVVINQPTLFTVSAYDPDGDQLTYTWKVNGAVEQSGLSNSFIRTFLSLSASTNVTVVFADPYGRRDSTSWTFKIVTTIEGDENVVLSTFFLAQNYPNPFNPSTKIGFKLHVSGFTSLKVFDLLGREVATLVNEEKTPGTYTMTWDATGMLGGVYFYRLTAGDFSAVRKLILLR